MILLESGYSGTVVGLPERYTAVTNRWNHWFFLNTLLEAFGQGEVCNILHTNHAHQPGLIYLVGSRLKFVYASDMANFLRSRELQRSRIGPCNCPKWVVEKRLPLAKTFLKSDEQMCESPIWWLATGTHSLIVFSYLSFNSSSHWRILRQCSDWTMYDNQVKKKMMILLYWPVQLNW